jgi:hypothetical protein
MVLPLVGGVVMTLIPHCEHHHTTTRGFVETVNWNLNGARNSKDAHVLWIQTIHESFASGPAYSFPGYDNYIDIRFSFIGIEPTERY